ncbi:MAG: BACON domain-containing protein, partial [Vicinamibacterales bacterium]
MFRHLDRSLRAGTFLGFLALTAACGSSTATSTAPSSLTRCGVTLNGAGTVPAAGGSATISVTAARECEWSATTEASWLSIKAGARGQGNGSVELAASANPDPAVRRGSVVLNEQRLELTQAAGECSFTLAEGSATIPRTGGSGRVDLRASSSLCTWTVEADSAWIEIKGQPNGRGSMQIPFDVSATTGLGRRGAIRVAGQEFEVVQSEGCVYTLSPSSHEVGGAGGSGAVTVTTGPGCPWTAESGVGWLTLSGDRGTGPGSISFNVAATNAARTGSATIAGRTFTVTQSVSPAPAPSPTPAPTP